MLRRLRDRRRDEDGFTLIELVMAVAILGFVMAAIAAAMAVAFRSHSETDARLTESRDVQFASTWFGDDVQNANRIAVGGTPNCGTDTTAVVRFANTDYLTPPATFPTAPPDSLRVSYVLRDALGGTVKELHRLECSTGSPQDTVVARTLSPLVADAPSVVCLPATGSTAVSCTAATARRVVLTLTELRQAGSSPLVYTLHGTRRSS